VLDLQEARDEGGFFESQYGVLSPLGIIEVAYRMNLPEKGHVAKSIWPKASASI